MSTLTSHPLRYRVTVSLLMALPSTVLLVYLIARYWAFFRLGTAGANGMALGLFILPFGFLLNWGVGLLTLTYALRKGTGRSIALATTAIALLLLVAVLFTGEVWRTSSLPREGDQTFRDFFRAIM